MSKDIQTKIMEAGIVPENAVTQMENWKTMPNGSSLEVKRPDIKKVDRLRDELEIQQLPVSSEAMFDVKKIMGESRPVNLFYGSLKILGVLAGVDRLNRYIIKIPDLDTEMILTSLMHPCTILVDFSLSPPENLRTITSISVIANTIQKRKRKLSTPTHWLCETESAGKENYIKGVY
jgi:hypothetical protein